MDQKEKTSNKKKNSTVVDFLGDISKEEFQKTLKRVSRKIKNIKK